MKGKEILKFICGILALTVMVSILIYFFIPNFQFRTFELNRTYSVVFGLTSILLCILLFFLIKNIRNGKTRRILNFINGIGLIASILTLFVFYKNIDPDVQFRNSGILFVSQQNTNEKIIRQFDINWKTNEKEFINNHVVDFGIFRVYKAYGIDTLNLDKKWK